MDQGPGQDRGLARNPVEPRGAGLTADPDALFTEANRLAELGRTDEARDAYLKVLALDHAHEGALNNLGALLYDAGFRSAARTAYRQAVALHPHRPMGRINLGNLLRAEGALDEARAEFEAVLAQDPDDPEAHRGLGQTLDDLGLRQEAWPHHEKAWRGQAVRVLPWRGSGKPLRVLTPVAAVGGNIPTRFILDPARVQQIVVVAEFADPSEPVPDHDLVFNTVGDADLCAVALDRLEALLARTKAPVLNPPARVRSTGRAALAEALSGVPGLRTPRMLSLPRQAFTDGAAEAALERAGLGFPLLLRAEGFHTGRHFVRVEQRRELAATAAALPGDALIAIEPLDACGADGRYRKYRVMSLGGRLHPLHLAVSNQWKVHYFTAAMADDAAFRAEEEGFLSDMTAVLGRKAVAALERVAEALGLDYAGMDFALDAAGRVLLFEANATMVINPPEPDPVWDYRRPAIERALAAAKALITL